MMKRIPWILPRSFRAGLSLLLVCAQLLTTLGLPWQVQAAAESGPSQASYPMRDLLPVVLLPRTGQPASVPPEAPVSAPAGLVGVNITMTPTNQAGRITQAYNGEIITYTASLYNGSSQPIWGLKVEGSLPKSTAGSPRGDKYTFATVSCNPACTRQETPYFITEPSGGQVVVSTTTGMSWTTGITLMPREAITLVYWGKVFGVTEKDVFEARLSASYIHTTTTFPYTQTGFIESNKVPITTYVNIVEGQGVGVSQVPNWISDDRGGTISQDWGDFDRDGFLDLVLASSSFGVSVYHNEGLSGDNSRNYRNRRLVSYWDLIRVQSEDLDRMALGVRWADLDKDGWLEIAVVGNSTDHTPAGKGLNYIYHFSPTAGTNRAGRFWQTDVFTSDAQLVRLAPGDYDRDGDVDLVASTNLINARRPVLYYPNNGNGRFSTVSPIVIGDRATAALGAGDYDNDADLDLAVGVFPNTLRVLENQCSQSSCLLNTTNPFSGSQLITVETGLEYLPYDLSWADYNRDGFLDLAAAYPLQREVHVYRNVPGDSKRSMSRLAMPLYTAPFMTPLALDWGDFNGDGTPDLAIADAPLRVYQPVFNASAGSEYFAPITEMVAPAGTGHVWSLRGVDFSTKDNLDLVMSDQNGPTQLFSLFASKLSPEIQPIPESQVVTPVISSLAWGDTQRDRDLYLDLLAGTDSKVLIYQNSTGIFRNSNAIPIDVSGMAPYRVALGDVDNNGWLDVVVGTQSSLQIYETNHDAPLQQPLDLYFQGIRSVKDVALADCNDDGWLEILLAFNTGEVSLYRVRSLGRGQGFTATETWVMPNLGDVQSVAWADFDKDNYLDFAVGVNNGPTRVMRNNGDHSFSPAWTSGLTPSTRSVAWADYDRDGDLDLALGNHDQPDEVWENNWNRLNDAGPFIVHPLGGANSPTHTTSIAWGDWNNDGYADLAAGRDGGEPTIVYGNMGSSPLNPRLVEAWRSNARDNVTAVAWGDRDGDGDLELAVAQDSQSGTNGFYENHLFEPAQIESLLNAATPMQNMVPSIYVYRPTDNAAAAAPDAYLYSSSRLLGQTPHTTVTVKYFVYDAEKDPVISTTFDYSLDGGATWLAATAVTTPTYSFGFTDAAKYEGTFYWNVGVDAAISDNARFRVRVITKNSYGPVQSAMSAGISPPFRVRGTSCVWPYDLAIVHTPKFILPGQTVRITGTSASSGGNQTMKLDFGDGSAPVSTWQATHVYTPAGRYTVTFSIQGQACPVSRTGYARVVLRVGVYDYQNYLPLVVKNVTTTQTLSARSLPPAASAESPVPAEVEVVPIVPVEPEGAAPAAAEPLLPTAQSPAPRLSEGAPERTDWAGIVRRISDATLQLTRYALWVNSQPAVSRDGSRIAFWSTGYFGSKTFNEDGNIEIVLARLDPNEKVVTFTQVTSSTGSILAGFNLNPSMDDSGEHIVFFSDRDLVGKNPEHNFEVFMAEVKDEGPIRLVQLTQTPRGMNIMPFISRNGKYVVFASDQDSTPGVDEGQTDIYRMEIAYTDTVAGPQVITSTQITSAPIGLDDQPVINNAGDRIAFVSNRNYSTDPQRQNLDGNREIFLAGIAADGAVTFTQITSSSLGINDSPVMDGDGEHVVFVSNLDLTTGGTQIQSERDIYLVTPTDSLNLTLISTDPGDMEQPSISSGDEKENGVLRIAYTANNFDGFSTRHRLYLYDFSSKTELAKDTIEGIYPALSSSGTALAYVSDWNIMRSSFPYADVEITKTASPASVREHTPLTYTLVVTNRGPSAMNDVWVIDRMPAGIVLTGSYTTTQAFEFKDGNPIPSGSANVLIANNYLRISQGRNSNAFPSVTGTTGWMDMQDNRLLLDFDRVTAESPAQPVDPITGKVYRCTNADPVACQQVPGGGKFSSAWSLWGAALSASSNPSLGLRTAHTFMAWVRPEDSGGDQLLLWKYGEYGLVRYITGTLVGRLGITETFNSGYIVPRGRWSHVAMVIEGMPGEPGYLNLYVDGGQVLRSPINVPLDYNSILYIGGSPYSLLYRGLLDELAVFDHPFSPAEIEWVYRIQGPRYAGSYESTLIKDPLNNGWRSLEWWTNRPLGKELPEYGKADASSDKNEGYAQGLVTMTNNLLLLHLNEQGNSQAFLDSSGLGHDAFCESEAPCPKSGVAGRFNNALYFDGQNDWFFVDNFGLDNSELSLSAWINPNYSQSSVPLFSKVSQTGTMLINFSISNNSPTNPSYAFYLDGKTIYFTSTLLNSDAPSWRHLALVLRPLTPTSSLRQAVLYENGQAITPTIGITTVDAASFAPLNDREADQRWAFGRDQQTGRYYSGRMDEIALFNRGLNDSEAKEIYRRGASQVAYQIQDCGSGASCAGQPFTGPGRAPDLAYSEFSNIEYGHPRVPLEGMSSHPALKYRIYLSSDLNIAPGSDPNRDGPYVRQLALSPQVGCYKNVLTATEVVSCQLSSWIGPMLPGRAITIVLPVSATENLVDGAHVVDENYWITNIATTTSQTGEQDYVPENNTGRADTLLEDLPVAYVTLAGPKVVTAGATINFEATAWPGIARLPISYTWYYKATEWRVDHLYRNSRTDTYGYNFPTSDSGTTVTLRVKVTNGWNPRTVDYPVRIEKPLQGVALTSNNNPTRLGRATNFHVNIDDGSAYSYTLFFGDGTSAAVTGLSGSYDLDYTHPYTEGKVYTATLVAENPLDILTRTLVITVNQTCWVQLVNNLQVTTPYSNIQNAIDASTQPDDLIKVSGTCYDVLTHGTHSEVIYLNKSRTIQGGYNHDFTAGPDPASYPTTVDAESNGRVVYLEGASRPVLENLILINGQADQNGGALYSQNSDGVTLRQVEVLTNTVTNGAGGGLYFAGGTNHLQNCKIQNNQAKTSGGGLYSTGASTTLVMTDCQVQRNRVTNSDGDGGGLYLTGGKATLQGSTVYNNNAGTNTGGFGGGLYNNGTLGLTQTQILSNSAGEAGAGLYHTSSALVTGRAVTVTNNSAVKGGGLYLDSGSAVLNDSQFSQNTATGSDGGGGLYLRTGTLTLVSSTVSLNRVTDSNGNGGGVYVNGGTLTLNGSNIEQNQARDGAGIYFNSGSHTLTGGTVLSNTGTDEGGGFYSANSVTQITVDGVRYQGNRAYTGGAFYLGIGTIIVRNSLITTNIVTGCGGGFYVKNTTLTFENNQVVRNLSGENGGGAYFSNPSPTLITGTLFEGNRAEHTWPASVHPMGGGIYLSQATSARFENNRVIDNYASDDGGGIYIGDSSPLFSRTIISGNVSGDDGGGVVLASDSDPTFVNTVVARNKLNLTDYTDGTGPAQRGSGVYVDGGDPVFKHATLTGNDGGSASNENAVYIENNETVKLYNVIVANHSEATAVLNEGNQNNCTIDGVLWSNTASNYSSCNQSHYRNGNPLFAADGYHLASSLSPAHDTTYRAPDNLVADVTVDIDGHVRPVGETYDVGADEFGYDFKVTLVSSPQPLAGQALVYTVSVTNTGALSETPLITTVLPSQVTPLQPVDLDLGVLEPNQTWTRLITVQASSAYTGWITATAYVTVPGRITITVPYSVYVKETPVEGLSFIHTLPIRNNEAALFTAAITRGTNVRYTWDFGDGDRTQITQTNLPAISHTFINSGTSIVTVTASNAYPSSLVVTKPVTIEFGMDLPITGITLTHSSPTEVEDLITFDAEVAQGSNIVYEWNFGDGQTASGYGMRNVSHSYALSNTYHIIVTGTNALGSDVATYDLWVPDKEIQGLRFTRTTTPEMGVVMNFAAQKDQGTNVTYEWNFGDGAVDTGPNVNHSYTITGPVTVLLTATNTIGSVTDSQTFTVEQRLANLGFTHTERVEIGRVAIFTATLGQGSHVFYAWDFNDGTTVTGNPVTHTYPAPGGQVVTVTAVNSINGLESGRVVKVWDQPVQGLTFTHSISPQVGLIAYFTATALGTNNLYTWDFGDGQGSTGSSTTVTHVYTLPNNYPVSVTAQNDGSLVWVSRDVRVEDQAVQGLAITHSAPTQLGVPVVFTAETTQGTNLTYSWNFGDGQNGTDSPITHTYATTGVMTVWLIVNNSRGPIGISIPITVEQPLAGLALATAPGIMEVNRPTFFTGTVTQGWPANYRWRFNDGVAGTTNPFSRNFSSPGVYTLALTATNTLNAVSLTQVITVEEPITGLNFNHSLPQVGQSIALTGTVTKGWPVAYSWGFTDSVTPVDGNPITHVFPATGTYQVWISATNHLTPVYLTRFITIEAPISGLNYSTTVPAQINAPANFTASIATGSHVAYTWAFTDGTTLTGPLTSRTFANPGTYTFWLTASNHLAPASIMGIINVEQPITGLTFQNSQPEVNRTVYFTGSVAQGWPIVNYTWAFTDSGPLVGGSLYSRTFSAPGVYSVWVTATNSLTPAAFTKQITVEQAIAGLTFQNSLPVANQTTYFTAATTQGWPITNYTWTFTDSLPVATAGPQYSRSFSAPGVYSVWVTATNHLTPAAFTKQITVEQALVGLNVQNSPLPAVGQPVYFTGTLTQGWPAAYTWGFSDAVPAAGGPLYSRTFSAPGVYTLWVTATNSLGPVTYTKTLTVYEPIAGLGILNSRLEVGPLVYFTGTVTQGTPVTYTWIFTDSGPTVADSMSRGFGAPGVYSVGVTATNSLGPVYFTKFITIEQSISGVGIQNSPLPAVGQPVYFTGTVAQGWPVTYTWIFTDSGPTVMNSISRTFSAPGVYSVGVTATNGLGAIYFTKFITVAQPIAGVGYQNSWPEVGKTIYFTGTVAQGWPVTSYTWVFTDSGPTTGNSTSHSFGAIGVYEVGITATNDLGTVYVTRFITVEQPIAGVSLENSPLPEVNQTVYFTGSVAQGWPVTGYTWVFTGSAPVTTADPWYSRTFSAPGVYSVGVTATNHLTPVYFTKFITVEQTIQGVGIQNSPLPEVGQPVYFTGTVTQGWPVTYTWIFTDSGPTAGKSMSRSFGTPGVYSVGVTASNSLTSVYFTKFITVDQRIAGLDFIYTPNPLHENEQGTFTATITQGTNVSYVWNFPYYGIKYGNPVSQAYVNNGDRTIVVTATNVFGSVTISKVVHINNKSGRKSPPSRLGRPAVKRALRVGIVERRNRLSFRGLGLY